MAESPVTPDIQPIIRPKLTRLVGQIRGLMLTHQSPVDKDTKAAQMISRYCERQIRNRLLWLYLICIAEAALIIIQFIVHVSF